MKYIGDSSIWSTYYFTYVNKENITFLSNNILLWRAAYLNITYISLYKEMPNLNDIIIIKDLFVLEGWHHVLLDEVKPYIAFL
jgi:hypothetical protein